MVQTAPTKRESLLLNLVCNVLAPILILTKLSGEGQLGPGPALALAVAFPVAYGAADWIRRRRFNMLSALGLANALVTGLIGFVEANGIWIAVKEASFPALIGLCVLLSMRTSNPLVRTFLYNDQVMDVPRIERELEARGNRRAFASLLDSATYILVASFVASAVLNFALAKIVVTSPGGTTEFNEQVGRMNAYAWLVIVLPSMAIMSYALYKLLAGIKRLTGLGLEDVVVGGKKPGEANGPAQS